MVNPVCPLDSGLLKVNQRGFMALNLRFLRPAVHTDKRRGNIFGIKMRTKYFWVLVALFVVWLLVPISAVAQVKSADDLRLEQIQEFIEWRAKLPDYEKRLYERVKKINRRQVRIQKYTIIGFVLVLLLVPGLVYVVIRQNSVQMASDNQRTGGASPEPTIRNLKKMARQCEAIRLQQASLGKSFNELKTYFAASSEQAEHFTYLLEKAEKNLAALDQSIADADKPDA
jgi:hypothetical protein